MTAEMVLSERPWYREPWPWILISGPAVVVVAGFVTLWLAVSSSDGLVAEDYYKQGLAINRVIEREEAAQKLGLTARIVPIPGRLVVRLSGTPGAHPPALFVRLALTALRCCVVSMWSTSAEMIFWLFGDLERAT